MKIKRGYAETILGAYIPPAPEASPFHLQPLTHAVRLIQEFIRLMDRYLRRSVLTLKDRYRAKFLLYVG